MLATILANSCPLNLMGLDSWPSLSVLSIMSIIGLWLVFQKAGKEGWAAIIPIYNILVLIKIACRPWWWILLFLIPVVNIIIYILLMNDLGNAFRKGTGFKLGLILLFPIFILILGAGSSRHISASSSIR